MGCYGACYCGSRLLCYSLIHRLFLLCSGCAGFVGTTMLISRMQYLVGLSTLIGGYVWFLYHNREVSYRSAMNYTISRRQSKLYDARGFDLRKWEGLIEEANALRREIKNIANEYDVDWDEMEDEKSEKVAEALKKDRVARERKKGDKNRKGDEEDDET